MFWDTLRFAGVSDGKELACKGSDSRDRVQSVSQEDPLEEERSNPLQYSRTGESHADGAWWATVRRVARVGHHFVTKPLTITTFTIKNKNNNKHVWWGCKVLKEFPQWSSGQELNPPAHGCWFDLCLVISGPIFLVNRKAKHKTKRYLSQMLKA